MHAILFHPAHFRHLWSVSNLGNPVTSNNTHTHGIYRVYASSLYFPVALSPICKLSRDLPPYLSRGKRSRVCNSLNSLPRASPVKIRRHVCNKKKEREKRETRRGILTYYHGTLSLSKFMIRAYNRPAPSLRRFITFNVRNYSSIVSLHLFPPTGLASPDYGLQERKRNRCTSHQRDYASRVCIGCSAQGAERWCVRKVSLVRCSFDDTL